MTLVLQAKYPAEMPAAVTTKIQQHPQTFEFFQACRLLYHLTKTQQDDLIQFVTDLNLGFPVGELTQLQPLTGASTNAFVMTVNFMGLIGVNGVLPFLYTEQIIGQQRQKSTALVDFFSALQQRSIQLFYRAWRQNRPLISYEYAKIQDRSCDDFSRHVLSLTGISDPTTATLPCHHDGLVAMAGLLLGKQRPRFGLSQVLQHFFGVTVTVKEFCGTWLKLNETEQSLLPTTQTPLGRYNHLGVDSMLGERVLNLQSNVRVKIGPLSAKRFKQFLPSGRSYQPLCQFIRYYLGFECSFDIQLNLAPETITPCQFTTKPTARLGWSSWLAADTNNNFDTQVVLC